MTAIERFRGNGNCWIVDGNHQRRGWAIFCCVCAEACRTVAIGKKAPIPPVEIMRRYAMRGWRVGDTAADDVCASCLARSRTDGMRRKELHDKNVRKASGLLAQIAALDRYMTENVALTKTSEFIDEKAELVHAFGSLMETAFIYEIVPGKWQERSPLADDAHVDGSNDASPQPEPQQSEPQEQEPPTPLASTKMLEHMRRMRKQMNGA